MFIYKCTYVLSQWFKICIFNMYVLLFSCSAPGDYSESFLEFTFSASKEVMELTIDVVDDRIVESSESFSIIVESPPGEMGVRINQNTTMVQILDDRDGKTKTFLYKFICNMPCKSLLLSED